MNRAFDYSGLKVRLHQEATIPQLGETPPPTAAVAIIIDPNYYGGSILLIERTERPGDPWSGQIAFPGGHKSREDATFLETAIREANEEVGIDLQKDIALGFLSPMYSRTRRVRVVPYVFQLRGRVTIRQNSEVAESFWVPLGALEAMNTSRTEVQVDEGKLQVDAYIYLGHVIWGLTFRIINVLIGRSSTDNT